jgi:hypothetical protein
LKEKRRKLAIFFTWFKQKIIEGCLNILFPYLACRQKNWLNLSVDYCHFGYITELTPNKKHLFALNLWQGQFWWYNSLALN